MSNPLPVFPASKIKEIIFQDPDLKDIPKKGIEMLRIAAEQYVHYVFQKCAEEAKKKKRTTMNKKDFDMAVQNDPALKACLGQFYITPNQEGEDQPQKADESAIIEEKQQEEPVFEEEEIHEDLPDEKEPIKQEPEETFLSDSEEEEKKSAQPSIEQSEISDLEPDAADM